MCGYKLTTTTYLHNKAEPKLYLSRVACDSVTSPLPTAKRTPVRPVAVGSRSQVPPPGLPQFCEDRNNASHLPASPTPDALRRRCFTHAGGRSLRLASNSLKKQK
nr:hypothetical protein Itr_chr06CG19220 [Ipomoea trifida]